MNTLPAESGTRARFLIIRRDNIGDLVCTTPLIESLRKKFPDAYIAALVNGYNKGVLARNPHLDAIHHYVKAKHARENQRVIGLHLNRLALIWKLRRQRFDYIILGNSNFQAGAVRFARLIGAKHVIGYVPTKGELRTIDTPIRRKDGEIIHEVVAVNRLLAPLGIDGTPPPARVYPDEHKAACVRKLLNLSSDDYVVGVHISARLTQGRWPAEKFVQLIARLSRSGGTKILLFWAPGSQNDSRHPGDDEKAKAILDRCAGYAVLAYPTRELEELVVGLSLCDTVICSDGGAMHIAAALDKKIVALFGADPERWHPWQSRHVVLRAASTKVGDIGVDEVLDAYNTLAPAVEPALA